jgi:hypothetical protein
MSHRSSLSGPNWRVFIACLHQYVLAVSLAHAKEENSRVELQQATTAITTVVEKGALEK